MTATREQENAAEAVALAHGRSAVLAGPTPETVRIVAPSGACVVLDEDGRPTPDRPCFSVDWGIS